MRKKRVLSIMLSLVMVLGLMIGLSSTAYADDSYTSLKNTTTVITFDGNPWYLIDYDTSTVTLLANEYIIDRIQYNSSEISYAVCQCLDMWICVYMFFVSPATFYFYLAW